MRSTDRQQLQDTLKLIGECFDDAIMPISDSSIRSAFNSEKLFAALVLNDERMIKSALAEETTFITRIFDGLLAGSAIRFPADATPSQTEYLLRTSWEFLVAAKRFDLAFILKQQYPSSPFLKTAVAEEEAAQLSGWDPADAESTARHAASAMLHFDRERLSQLVGHDIEFPPTMLAPPFCPVPLDSWFWLPRTARSSVLVDAVSATLPVEVQTLGEHGAVVVFAPIDSESERFEVDLVKDLDGGTWRVVLDDHELSSYLIELLEAGQHTSVRSWLDRKMPAPKKGLFSWFGSDENLTPAQKLWQRIDVSHDYRTELVARAWASELQRDLEFLDPWLADNPIEFSAARMADIDQLREEAWWAKRDFAILYERQVSRIVRADSNEAVPQLIRLLDADRRAGGKLIADARWRPLVNQYLAEHADKTTARETQARYGAAFLLDRIDQAFAIIEDAIEGDVSGAANTYLWQSLVRDADEATLRQRYEFVKEHAPFSENEHPNYLHTLACVQARLGMPQDALAILRQLVIAHADTDNDLIRALVFEQLQFPAAAVEHYRRMIESDPVSDTAQISQLGLRRLGVEP